VLIVNSPLIPYRPAFGVLMRIDPLEEWELKPLDMKTLPPVAPPLAKKEVDPAESIN